MDWTAILKQGGVPEPPGYRGDSGKDQLEAKEAEKAEEKAKGKKKA